MNFVVFAQLSHLLLILVAEHVGALSGAHNVGG